MSAMLQLPLSVALLCPYFRSETESCRLSCDASSLNNRTRRRYCRTEDHEDCPLFLSHMLRNSAPMFRGELDYFTK
ncbi:MAG: hypothetical protein C0621_05960 [Desulfuromonas sp.]|nr:MAG: hypothetical protein C0621_05960 [Desulfuromonas sp.]